ncbi:hypothetical protein IFR04_007719 [Cadophora malorum]|uniref:Glycoside hydrolase 131 catalytic N-terminal domain-containing protein n=1 Tax=Cadophora malorum TaxID=108018 RepID=A0A8H7THY1_9HELO|nr:hypothetical protein IFR04_007719 [Cadophora malorum]
MRLLPVLAIAASVGAQKCPLQFDGRVPEDATLTTFDGSSSPFNAQYVLGANLKWSGVLQLPNVNSSLFDAAGTKAVEVTINDKSTFNSQTGFRRAELLPLSNSGTDASTTGIKTMHFSVMKDTARPLDTAHEYQLFFLESSDYSTNQVVLKYGSIIGGNPGGANPDTLFLQGNVNSKPISTIFSVRFTPGTWHNFGLVLDFVKGTTQVYYSTGNNPLASVSKAVTNNVAGQGQYHFGVLKKPVNPGSDITKSGKQPSGINEGVIFGGIFEEDSSLNSCISLSP